MGTRHTQPPTAPRTARTRASRAAAWRASPAPAPPCSPPHSPPARTPTRRAPRPSYSATQTPRRARAAAGCRHCPPREHEEDREDDPAEVAEDYDAGVADEAVW